MQGLSVLEDGPCPVPFGLPSDTALGEGLAVTTGQGQSHRDRRRPRRSGVGCITSLRRSSGSPGEARRTTSLAVSPVSSTAGNVALARIQPPRPHPIRRESAGTLRAPGRLQARFVARRMALPLTRADAPVRCPNHRQGPVAAGLRPRPGGRMRNGRSGVLLRQAQRY